MNKVDFEGMCELFGDGQLIWVENQNSHVEGRVVGCDGEMIEVKVGKYNEKWDRRECGEMTHGFKVKYDEVKKHPHEYDTHLD